MGKKEASKGREWEKGRRDVLNQTFDELHKALPSYVEGHSISKKTILIQALDCIKLLKGSERNEVQGTKPLDVKAILKWLQHILQKFSQLVSFLIASNVEVPTHYLSLGAPPAGLSSNIEKLLSKIEHCLHAPKNVTHGKLKKGPKLKGDVRSGNVGFTSPKAVAPNNFVSAPCSDLKRDDQPSLITNPPVIRSNALVVQPSPLQTQLVFTTGASSAPLPVLVSVTGVKTANPVIFVQSSVMTQPQKVVSTTSSSRNACPILPGPPSKLSKKLKKVPIPPLKPKAVLRNISSQSTGPKILKREPGSIVVKNFKDIDRTADSQKSSKANRSLKSTSVKSTNPLDCPLNTSKKIAENTSQTSEKLSTYIGKGKQDKISDVNKENVAENDGSSMPLGEGKKLDNLSSAAPEEICIITEPNHLKEITADGTKDVHSDTPSVQKLIQNEGKKHEEPSAEGSIHLEKKRPCKEDFNSKNVKRSKLDSKFKGNDGEISSKGGVNGNVSDERSSPAKVSKSNYTISALCSSQQLLQGAGNSSHTCEDNNVQEVIEQDNNSELENSKQDSARHQTNVPSQIQCDKSNENFCTIGKNKEAPPSDLYSDWSDKSRFKVDRVCASYNIFSSLPVHNSKNTFIPIGDIDNFKTVPEPFDASDSSFGLPLHSSDISNDIFASLQVPTGGHHSESISPTAAFLLAFPLVSTSKASELLSDEVVCENNDSQPGMKTILQIGNLDCDTPVTKCVSVFSSIDNNCIVDAAPNVFNQDTLSVPIVKSKPQHVTMDTGNFMPKHRLEFDPQKCNNGESLMPLKESANYVQKNLGTSVELKAFPPKTIYQTPCSNSNKLSCQSRNEPTSVSTVSNQSLPVSQLHSSAIPSGHQLPGTSLNKASLKLNTSQQSGTFLVCDKQTDWLEIPQSSQASFPDFQSANTSRSDCAVNYVLPPILMSSSTNSEELVSVSRSQPSTGILSWSTMTLSENIESSKQSVKSSHILESFSSVKDSSKETEIHQGISTHSASTSAPSQNQLLPGPGLVNGIKVNLGVTTYNGTQNISNSSEGLLLSSKQSASTNNFISSDSNPEAKKLFGAKHVECSSTEAMKVSTNSNASALFSAQPANLGQVTPASSSSIVYSSAEIKQGRVNNSYYNNRTQPENLKPGMNSTSNGQISNKTLNLPNYDHNTLILEVKQMSTGSGYNHIPNLNGKTVNHDHPVMNTSHHQNDNLMKQQATPNNHFSVGAIGLSDSKKNLSHFNENSEAPANLPKQATSAVNFNLENTSNVMQYSSSSINLTSGNQDQYNHKPSSLEVHHVKSQQSQQRQQCGRPNKESVPSNLHRPPVNWMTAPDIRCHQHHNGPAFGNNMNSTQGLFYFPEHVKESENPVTMFDHCLDVPHTSQPLYKGNEVHLFGNENLESFHDNSAWSPNKSGSASMLGNMMISSTLPTLVGDLALGDNTINRPFLPPYSNDTQACPKKSAKRNLNLSKRATDKPVEDSNILPGQTQECVASFLSVSQLVDTSSVSKSRTGASTKEVITSFTASFSENDTAVCHSTKQNSSKPISSNYSTEALLSSTNAQQMAHLSHRKRRSHGAHYPNSYVGTSVPYQNSSHVTLQVEGSQTQFLPDFPRANDYSGTFLPSDSVPSFMLGNPPRSHRNHSYPLTNIVEDNSSIQKTHPSTSTTGRHRTGHNHPVVNSSSSTVASSTNIIDFGYMNMSSTMLSDDINLTNHTHSNSHPTYLSHPSYPMPTTQDTLYSAPRLSMHPPQNNSVQSPSATTLTNFHLSTIFPEINEKVVC